MLESRLLHYFIFSSSHFFFFLMILRPPRSTLFPYTTLFRSKDRFHPPRWASVHARGFQAKLAGHAGQVLLEIRERSEEHTSELQSLRHLVCRLLLEKKKKKKHIITVRTE